MTGYTRENIREMLLYACTGGLSRESLHIQKQLCLLAELKTSDVKYIAIEEAKKLIQEKWKDFEKLDSYYKGEAVNELCNTVLILSIALAEPEKGIKYFFSKAVGSNKEILLYRALEIAEWMDEPSIWVEFYKFGLSKKIVPRTSLQEQYREYKEKISPKEER